MSEEDSSDEKPSKRKKKVSLFGSSKEKKEKISENSVVDVEIASHKISPEYDIRFTVSEFPDIDGERLFIPRFIPVKNGEPEDDILLVMESYGYEFGEGKISQEDKDRLKFCIDDLKLPLLLATHLALNRKDMDVSEFVVPDEDVRETLQISVSGPTMVGKSTLVAMIGLYYGINTETLDRFTHDTPERYLEMLKENGYTNESDVFDIVRFFDAKMHVSPEERLKRDKPEPMSMREILDDQLDRYKNGDRPFVEVFDTPGQPNPMNSAIKEEEMRPLNVFDVVSTNSFEATIDVNGGFHQLTGRLGLGDYEKVLVDFPDVVRRADEFSKKRRDFILDALS